MISCVMQPRTAVMLVLLVLVALLGAGAQAALPSGVTSRLKKIDQHMQKVEDSLAAQRVNRNELERAQGLLGEIVKQYPDSAEAEEVRKARKRIEDGAAAIAKLEQEQAAAKQAAAADANAADKRAEEWADKLAVYKADSKDGAKGQFGVPISEPAKLVALAPHYQEAKALYAAFLQSGIDKESHWKLRQAEYDIRVALENYDGSRRRLTEEAAASVKEGVEQLTAQQGRPDPLPLSADHLRAIADKVAGMRVLYPADSPELRALNAAFAEVETRQAALEQIVLERRRMKPDAFRGPEAATLKQLAKSVVLKEHPNAAILRIHITSAAWQHEAVEEWTDTTKTALRRRVTKSVTAQVALTRDAGCFLYTLYLGQDTINNAVNPLTGHVMHRDKFLEKNLPK